MYRFVLALTLVAALLSACSSSSDSTPPSPTAVAPTNTPAVTSTLEPSTTPLPPTPTATTVPPPTATAVPTVAPQPTSAPAPTQPPPPPPGPPASSTIDVTAKNIEYSTSVLTVKSGALVTVNFTNQDAGVTHDLSFGIAGLPHGNTCAGPCTDTYTFTAPAPGTYSFFCTVHATMTGTLNVVP